MPSPLVSWVVAATSWVGSFVLLVAWVKHCLGVKSSTTTPIQPAAAAGAERVTPEQAWEEYNAALVQAMKQTQLQLLPAVYDPRRIATIFAWERNTYRRAPRPTVEETP